MHTGVVTASIPDLTVFAAFIKQIATRFSEAKPMLSLSTSLRPRWVANMDRNRVVKINSVNYELHLTSATRGRLLCHKLVAGTPQLVNIIEIPLSTIELESMFDVKTAAAIMRLAKELGA
jgi:hypothetical protein